MRIAAFTLLLGSLVLAACEDDNKDGLIAPGIRSGTFILQTVDGQELPVVVLDTISPPLLVEAVSGSITLATNGRFIDITEFRLSLSNLEVFQDRESRRRVACFGTFTFSADTLTFVESGPTPDCSRTFTGILGANTLTASLRGVPAVYAR